MIIRRLSLRGAFVTMCGLLLGGCPTGVTLHQVDGRLLETFNSAKQAQYAPTQESLLTGGPTDTVYSATFRDIARQAVEAAEKVKAKEPQDAIALYRNAAVALWQDERLRAKRGAAGDESLTILTVARAGRQLCNTGGLRDKEPAHCGMIDIAEALTEHDSLLPKFDEFADPIIKEDVLAGKRVTDPQAAKTAERYRNNLDRIQDKMNSAVAGLPRNKLTEKFIDKAVVQQVIAWCSYAKAATIIDNVGAKSSPLTSCAVAESVCRGREPADGAWTCATYRSRCEYQGVIAKTKKISSPPECDTFLDTIRKAEQKQFGSTP